MASKFFFILPNFLPYFMIFESAVCPIYAKIWGENEEKSGLTAHSIELPKPETSNFGPQYITNTIVHWLWSTDSLEIMTLMDGSWGASTQTFTFASKMVLCGASRLRERAEDWGWTQNHRFYDPYVAIHLSFEAYFIAGYLHITLFSKDSRGLWLTSTILANALVKGFIKF